MVNPKRRSLTKLRGGHLKDDRYSVCVFHCSQPNCLSSTAVIPNIYHKTIHSHTQQPSRHHPHDTHHTRKDSVTCQKNRPTTDLATSLSEPEPPHGMFPLLESTAVWQFVTCDVSLEDLLPSFREIIVPQSSGSCSPKSGSCFPSDTASHPERFQSSAAALRT